MAFAKSVSAPTAAREIAALAKRRGGAIFIQGGPGEPVCLREAWRAEPELADALNIHALMLPGINSFDYTSLTPTTRMSLFLATANLANAIAAGRAALRPIHYTHAYRLIARTSFAVAVVHVAPPDQNGFCSIGLCADAAPAALQSAEFVVGVINRQMPAIAQAPTLPVSRFDLIIECDTPLSELARDGAPDDSKSAAIARFVGDLVRDGDTVQVGIGRLPSAILPALRHHTALRFHGGLLSPAHLHLAEQGVVRDELGALTGGVTLGDRAFYEATREEWRVRMAPIPQTHGADEIAKFERFIAINAALEVDLFGQVNCEWAGTRAIASIGGLGDFVRGARASPGGRSIIMLQAEGKDGASRIVPHLQGKTVTLSRADSDIVVTEFGVADLRDLDITERAAALAAIAAPQHRETILQQWRAL